MSEGQAKSQEKPRKFQAIKGVRDLLPPETALWNHVEQTAHSVFATYGYGEIRLPVFEQTELFARSIGEETDVVSKEMYTFADHFLAELENNRQVILSTKPVLTEGTSVLRFRDLFFSFQEEVQREPTNEEIPRTPENGRAIQALQELRDEFESWKGKALPSGKLEELCNAVHREVSRLRLGDVLSLRPEATASVCRAYIEHGMHTLPGNVKLYYIGPMFRRERPQKGRYRQFYQIGAEVLTPGQSGEWKTDARIDAEVIEMLVAFFGRLGLAGTALHLNSIGCSQCRPGYVGLLREELEKTKDNLGPDSRRRIETNPLRVLDSKLEEEQRIIEKLPRIADHLCENCRVHYAELKQQLALRGIVYEENWRLVRGLDYYMRTTFEITAPGLGSQNAVCGGGRYDGLVELLGGPPTKGIGFAIGEDRLLLSLHGTSKLKAAGGLDVFVAWMGEKTYSAALQVARRLRASGVAVEIPAVEMKFGKALGLADKLGARYALILGEDELASGQLTLKRLADGTQQKLSETQLLAYLKRGQ